EYRWAGTTGVEIRNNLTDASIVSRNGATGTVANNVTNGQTSWFVNAAAGDLHLLATATSAIDKGVTTPSVPKDYDGETRPSGLFPDVGADEFSSTGLQPPSSPTGLQVTP